MRQSTVIFCCSDDLLKVPVQLVDIDNHVFIQQRRSDIAHLLGGQTEALQVGSEAQLVTVSRSRTRVSALLLTYVFGNLQLQLPWYSEQAGHVDVCKWAGCALLSR